MIIDCHCHAGPGDGFTGPWDSGAPLGNYARRASRAGIARTVLFAAFHSDYAEANRGVARIVAERPDRYFGLAFLHAARDRGRIAAMVREAVERLGFVGIKLHRHDANITREVCDAARAYALPVLYDVVGEIAQAELLAEQYPDVDFILPHLGSFADDWRAQLGLIQHLERHPNIYTDTSGVRRFDLLAEAVRRAGAHKVLFGSDGPWLHPAVELAKVRALSLPPDSEALVLGGNFLRLTARARARRPSSDPSRRAHGIDLAPRAGRTPFPAAPRSGTASISSPGFSNGQAKSVSRVAADPRTTARNLASFAPASFERRRQGEELLIRPGSS